MVGEIDLFHLYAVLFTNFMNFMLEYASPRPEPCCLPPSTPFTVWRLGSLAVVDVKFATKTIAVLPHVQPHHLPHGLPACRCACWMRLKACHIAQLFPPCVCFSIWGASVGCVLGRGFGMLLRQEVTLDRNQRVLDRLEYRTRRCR